jgi:alpha-D-ribose 1-methylphosphonate 5-triphosphate synthase subunit PhnH
MSMLAPTFAQPALASQSVFRSVMDALAHPGEIKTITAQVAVPPPLGPAAAAVALTLLDYETPVWLDPPLAAIPEVAQWFRFHTGAPITADPREAAFAVVADAEAMTTFDAFSLGTADYPDRSTTLVLQVDGFAAGECLTLSGPGIRKTRTFSAAPLPADIRARLIANRALFPRGVDLILVSRNAVAALPRSIHVAPRG